MEKLLFYKSLHNAFCVLLSKRRVRYMASSDGKLGNTIRLLDILIEGDRQFTQLDERILLECIFDLGLLQIVTGTSRSVTDPISIDNPNVFGPRGELIGMLTKAPDARIEDWLFSVSIQASIKSSTRILATDLRFDPRLRGLAACDYMIPFANGVELIECTRLTLNSNDLSRSGEKIYAVACEKRRQIRSAEDRLELENPIRHLCIEFAGKDEISRQLEHGASALSTAGLNAQSIASLLTIANLRSMDFYDIITACWRETIVINGHAAALVQRVICDELTGRHYFHHAGITAEMYSRGPSHLSPSQFRFASTEFSDAQILDNFDSMADPDSFCRYNGSFDNPLKR